MAWLVPGKSEISTVLFFFLVLTRLSDTLILIRGGGNLTTDVAYHLRYVEFTILAFPQIWR